MYLLLGLSLLFSQNIAALFLKNCYLIVVPLKKLTKNILFNCLGLSFVPPFSKKSNTFKMAKKARKIGQT